MREDTAQRAIHLKNDIDTTRRQIKNLKGHSFGFGTSFYDIDNALRPLAKIYLDSKLKTLINELDYF